MMNCLIVTKIFGILMVFSSSSFMGIYLNSRKKNRIKELKSFLDAFSILSSEINFSVNKLSDASKKIYKKDDKSNCSIFFDIFSKNLESKKFNLASSAWADALDKIKITSYLENEDFFVLKNFCSVLDSLDKDIKIKSLKLIILDLDRKIIYLEKNFLMQKKLSNELGFILGILFIIIFL